MKVTPNSQMLTIFGVLRAKKHIMRLFFASSMALFGIACGEKIPKDVISQDLMPDVLVDMHLADGQLANMPIDSARASRDVFYQSVFNRYGIDSTAFRRSVQFYSTRPHILSVMYGNIEKKLEAMNKAEQQKIEAKYLEQRRVDSIKNALIQDSLRLIMRDSLNRDRARYLLFKQYPDSLYGAPDSLTYKGMWRRAQRAIGIDPTAVIMRPPILPPPPVHVPPIPPQPATTLHTTPRAKALQRIH